MADQINNWWSTYHQKRKSALNSLAGQANRDTTYSSRSSDFFNSVSMAIQFCPSRNHSASHTLFMYSHCTFHTGASFNCVDPANSYHDIRKHSGGHFYYLCLTHHTSNYCFNCACLANCSNDFGKVSASCSCCLFCTISMSNHCLNCASSANCSYDFQKNSAGHFHCLWTTFQTTVSPQFYASPLYGIPSSHTPCITEWNFPPYFSRSTLLGWLGCNACSFIALYFGNMYFLSSLEPPSDHVTLDHEWQVSLREAILKGNEIHDDLYDNDASDLAVDEAVELAGDECGVNCS